MNNQPEKSFWIPFALAGVLLFAMGFFRFADASENIHFISAMVVAFGVTAFPWINTLKIKGLVEIERAIDSVKHDTKEKVDDAKQHINDRIQVLQSSMNLVHNQVSQMSLRQDFSQNQNIFVGTESRGVSEEEMKEEEKIVKDLELSVGEQKGWLRRIVGFVRRPIIHKACEALSLPVSALQYEQHITVSSRTNADPIFSISEASFDAAHYGEIRHTFFKVLMKDTSWDDVSNLLFRFHSILQKYAEAKAIRYRVVLVALISQQNISSDNADKLERKMKDEFASFVSSDQLAFQRIETAEFLQKAKQTETPKADPGDRNSSSAPTESPGASESD